MRFGGLVAATLLVAAAPCDGAAFTQTADFGRFVTGSFDQFAPDLGSLIEVRLDWTATVSGDYQRVFDGPPPPPAGPIVVETEGSYNFFFFFPDLTNAGWSGTASNVQAFPEDTLAMVLSASSGGSDLLGGAGLSPFIGTDIIRVGGGGGFGDVTARNDAGPVALRESLPSTAHGTVTITYITADVPEPAGWTMLIAGFGLIGATMRRRSRLRLELYQPR